MDLNSKLAEKIKSGSATTDELSTSGSAAQYTRSGSGAAWGGSARAATQPRSGSGSESGSESEPQRLTNHLNSVDSR